MTDDVDDRCYDRVRGFDAIYGMFDRAAPTPFMNMSFINMNSMSPTRRHTSACIAWPICEAYNCVAGPLKQFQQGMEECKNATGEASFEAKGWNKNRTGVRRRRLDFFTGGGCIGGGGTDTGRAADAKLFADS